jgi:membrane-bound ClpP family serine protease
MHRPQNSLGGNVIILGIILIIVGLIAHVGILEWLGILLLIIGAVLAIAGSAGRSIGGRRHYY